VLGYLRIFFFVFLSLPATADAFVHKVNPYKKFDPLKMCSGGSCEFKTMSKNPGFCGRHSNLYVFKIRTDDIFLATEKLDDVLDEFSAQPQPAGCHFISGSEGNWSPDSAQISVTRWLKKSQLIAFGQRISKLGVPRYINEVSNEFKDSGPVSSEGPEEVLVNVFLFQQDSVDGNDPRQAADVPGVDPRSFPGIEAGLKAPLVDARRRAAQGLFDYLAGNWSQETPIGGVGIVLGSNPQGTIVADIVKGMPAGASGIHRGDEIVAVNDSSIAGKPREAVSAMIRGQVNTPVSITVKSAGKAPRRANLVRRGLVPSKGDILSVAESCTTDPDSQVRAACWGAFGAIGDSSQNALASKALIKILSDDDISARRRSLWSLWGVWSRGAVPGEDTLLFTYPATPEPRTVAVPPAADSQKHKVLPDSSCLVLRSNGGYGGVASMSLNGPRISTRVTFPPPLWGASSTEVSYGTFCGLYAGATYTSTSIGRNALRTVTHFDVVPGDWTLNVCMALDGKRSCGKSIPGIPPAVVKSARITARMEVAVSSESLRRYPKEKLCSNVTWSFDGDCKWSGAQSFYRERLIDGEQETNFSIADHGKAPESPAILTVRVSMDNSPATAQVGNLVLRSSQTGNVQIRMPQVGRPFVVHSDDGVVEMRAPFAGVVIGRRGTRPAAVPAVLRRKLQLMGVETYRFSGSPETAKSVSDFILTAPAPVSFSYQGDSVPRGLAVYGWDGVDWSTGSVTGQRIAVDSIKQRLTVSGNITRSGTYGVFSRGRDDTPPVTSIAFTRSTRSVEGDLVVSTGALVVLHATDPVIDGYSTQVATTYFRLDNTWGEEGFSVYFDSIPVGPGMHVLEYRSEDWAGNKESLKGAVFIIGANDERLRSSGFPAGWRPGIMNGILADEQMCNEDGRKQTLLQLDQANAIEAAETAGFCRFNEAAPQLRVNLQSKNPMLVAKSAEALSMMGDRGVRNLAVGWLTDKASKDPYSRGRLNWESAVNILGAVGTKVDLDILNSVIRLPESPESYAAARAIIMIMDREKLRLKDWKTNLLSRRIIMQAMPQSMFGLPDTASTRIKDDLHRIERVVGAPAADIFRQYMGDPAITYGHRLRALEAISAVLPVLGLVDAKPLLEEMAKNRDPELARAAKAQLALLTPNSPIKAIQSGQE